MEPDATKAVAESERGVWSAALCTCAHDMGNPEIKGNHCGRQNDCLTPQMGPGTGPGVLSVGVLCYTAKGNHGRKWI